MSEQIHNHEEGGKEDPALQIAMAARELANRIVLAAAAAGIPPPVFEVSIFGLARKIVALKPPMERQIILDWIAGKEPSLMADCRFM